MKILPIIYIALAAFLFGGLPCLAQDAVYEEVKNVVAESPSWVLKGNTLELSNPIGEETEVYVFGITGTLVRHATVPAQGFITIDLPAGYYILKLGNLSHRIVVR